jgi:hypothetical protein
MARWQADDRAAEQAARHERHAGDDDPVTHP